MAINNIPGVGPTNADIATAVAAPSASTIAAAVAAPSASTIATAVAAAVPTSSAITTIVQANAGSPYAGTWTYLGFVSGNGTSAVTYTGLGSYKYLKAQWVGIGASASADLALRINSDTGNNYAFSEIQSNASGNSYGSADSGQPWATVGGNIGTSNASSVVGNVEIIQSNSSTATKLFNYKGNTNNNTYKDGSGIWASTSAITSITFLPTSGTFSVSGSTRGFYLFGGN